MTPKQKMQMDKAEQAGRNFVADIRKENPPPKSQRVVTDKDYARLERVLIAKLHDVIE